MRFFVGIASLCLGFTAALTATSGYSAQQPMRPQIGYGSSSAYLCTEDCAERFDIGDVTDGKRISYYVPHILKHGNSAPVVVFMHGFFAPVPEIYQVHINHLLSQGYIVIFPQYQSASWAMLNDMGVFAPADQRTWVDNAVESTNEVLELLGSKAERTEIYGYGHSVGGVLLLGWEMAGGVPLKGMVLANPKLDLKSGIPDFVKAFIKVKVLPWREMADAITGRLVILSGEDDTISPVKELEEIKDYAKNATSRALFVAKSDRHDDAVIKADHMGPMTDAGLFKYLNWMMGLFGGKILLDTYDYHYYFASLDAMLDGQKDYQPQMGQWSDGAPFSGVTRLF